MSNAISFGDEDYEKIKALLVSDNAEAVTLGMQLLESVEASADVWKSLFNPGTVYSLCLLAHDGNRDSNLSKEFRNTADAGYSPAAIAGLLHAFSTSLKSASTRKVENYEKLWLGAEISPAGFKLLSTDTLDLPSLQPSDSSCLVCAIGSALGQIVWRDLSLAGKDFLEYELSSYRVQPHHECYLAGESQRAWDSPGCEFIHGCGTSGSPPWFSLETFIAHDDLEQLAWLFDGEYGGNDWRDEIDSPALSNKGLAFSALQGMTPDVGHVEVLRPQEFGKRISLFDKAENCIGPLHTARIKVLTQPVVESYPQACFTELNETRKRWLIDRFLEAAENVRFPEPASLAKHVLCWMTLHPALPENERERLRQLGFGIVEKASQCESTSAVEAAVREQEKPDKARIKQLRGIVKAWKKLCKEEQTEDFEESDSGGVPAEFLVAHYAQLVLNEEIQLTPSGWEFVDAHEDSIVSAADQ